MGGISWMKGAASTAPSFQWNESLPTIFPPCCGMRPYPPHPSLPWNAALPTASGARHERLQGALVTALHGRLRLEAQAIPADGGQRTDAASLAVGHARVARLEAAVDGQRVPLLGVAHVADP